MAPEDWVNPSMTPTGVEHNGTKQETLGIIKVNPSMTPTGVEHSPNDKPFEELFGVNPSMTPTGVEHAKLPAATRAAVSESLYDADRR